MVHYCYFVNSMVGESADFNPKIMVHDYVILLCVYQHVLYSTSRMQKIGAMTYAFLSLKCESVVHAATCNFCTNVKQ